MADGAEGLPPDIVRLAPFRLLDSEKRHPVFAQALASKNDVALWGLERLRALQADLSQMSDESNRRVSRLLAMQKYLQDAAAGRAPPPSAAHEVDAMEVDGFIKEEEDDVGDGGVAVPAVDMPSERRLSTTAAPSEPRLMADMADASEPSTPSRAVDAAKTRPTQSSPPATTAKRRLEVDADYVDDTSKRRRADAAESTESAPILKVSIRLDPEAALRDTSSSSSSSAAAPSAPSSSVSSFSSSSAHAGAHQFAGKGKRDDKPKQQQRRRRSAKAASSRNVADGAADGSPPPGSAADTPPAPSAPVAAAATIAGDEAPAGGRAKGGQPQSVAFETFRAFIEPYVRPYTDAELDLLEPMEDPDPFPYLIPPLGRDYLDVWAEESGEAPAKPPGGAPETESNGVPLLGTLTERLLASLVEEGLAVPSLADDEDDAHAHAANGVVPALPALRASELENRIRRELVYVGLLDEADEAPVAAADVQDDEICMQLRALQRLLREQIAINNARKARLYARVRAQLGVQEYEEVLADLHRQIEAGYAKRQKQVQPRGGKKKGKAAAPARARPPVADELIQLVQKANKLPLLVQTVFSRDVFAYPRESVYEGAEAAPNVDMRTALAAIPTPSRVVSELTSRDTAAAAPTIVGRG